MKGWHILVVLGLVAWFSVAGFSLAAEAKWWDKRWRYILIAGVLGLVGGIGIASPLLWQLGSGETRDLSILPLFFLCFGLLPSLIAGWQMHKAIRARNRWQKTRNEFERRGEEARNA